MLSHQRNKRLGLTCPLHGFEIVENGQLRCSDANHYASECLFLCDPGFELVDRYDRLVTDPSVRCMANETWSVEEAPRCIPTQCSPSAEEMSQVTLLFDIFFLSMRSLIFSFWTNQFKACVL